MCGDQVARAQGILIPKRPIRGAKGSLGRADDERLIHTRRRLLPLAPFTPLSDKAKL